MDTKLSYIPVNHVKPSLQHGECHRALYTPCLGQSWLGQQLQKMSLLGEAGKRVLGLSVQFLHLVTNLELFQNKGVLNIKRNYKVIQA
jgi:hypothetical protein